MHRVTLAETVKTIGEDAFAYQTGLTAVNGLENVTAIGAGAFNQCRMLTAIVPATVTRIGSGAFDGCTMVFYTVSVADTEHGAVSVSVDYQLESNLIPQNVPDGVIIADMGAAVTITAAPDTGCVLDSLTVTKDGTNPAEEVSIT